MSVFASVPSSAAAHAMSAQLVLQCAAFDLLAQQLAQNLARLEMLDGVIVESADVASARSRVVSLVQVRADIEIRQIRKHTAALSAQMVSAAADVQCTGHTLIDETRDRVVGMVALATGREADCSPSVVRSIKTAIDAANIKIERVRQCMTQVSTDGQRWQNDIRRQRAAGEL